MQHLPNLLLLLHLHLFLVGNLCCPCSSCCGCCPRFRSAVAAHVALLSATDLATFAALRRAVPQLYVLLVQLLGFLLRLQLLHQLLLLLRLQLLLSGSLCCPCNA